MVEQAPFYIISSILDLQNFFRPYVGPGDLCFDVGANHGEKTAAFLSLGASVVAIEPQQEVVAFLNQSFTEDISQGKLVIIDKALDKEDGEKLLHIANDYNKSMSTLSDDFVETIFNNSDRWQILSQTTVALTTLDKLIEQYGKPKFCKIDVEGMDYDVLQGLSYPVEYLSFEYNTNGKLLNLAVQCIKMIPRFQTRQ